MGNRLTDRAIMPDVTGTECEFFYIKDNQKITECELLDKLGQFEDILDKYNIDSSEELERIIINNKVLKLLRNKKDDVLLSIVKVSKNAHDYNFRRGINQLTSIEFNILKEWLENGEEGTETRQ